MSDVIDCANCGQDVYKDELVRVGRRLYCQPCADQEMKIQELRAKIVAVEALEKKWRTGNGDYFGDAITKWCADELTKAIGEKKEG